MFPAAVIEAAQAHAEAEYPRESCGLVVVENGASIYVPCENLAEVPEQTFSIDKNILLAAQKADTLQAVIHSHPDPAPACPSMPDMEAQVRMAIPWGIVPVTGWSALAPFFWGTDETRPWLQTGKLTGLPYRHGVTDCYSIVRDYYQVQWQLTLPEQPRGWGRDGPGVNEFNWYELLYKEFGFEVITFAEARPGDALLFQVGRSVINHAGVITEPGVMLHHGGGDKPWDPMRLSHHDPVSRWSQHLRYILRHRSLAGG